MTTARQLEPIPAQTLSLDQEASGEFPTDQIVTGQAKVSDTVVNYTVSLGGPEIIVLVPGLAGCEAFSTPMRNQLGRRGYAAVSYEAARSRQTIRGAAGVLLHPNMLHLDTLTAVINSIADNKALRDTEAGSELKLETVRLDPHSKGSHTAAHYARRHPTEVSSTVMLAPHGFEKFLALHLLRRSGMVVKDEFIPFLITHHSALVQEIAPAIFDHAAAGPLQLAFEGLGCVVDPNKLERLPLVGDTGRIAIMGFQRDKIIDSDCLARAAKLHGISFELHLDAKAGHFAPYTHAESVAELALEMHRRLEFPAPQLAA